MSAAGGARGRVVVAGGGVAGLEAALALRALAGDRADIELVAPEDRFVYRPFAVVEPFGGGAPWSYDLDTLLAPKGIRHRRDALAAVDPQAKVVHTRGGEDVRYDALLVALGARPVAALPGALTFAGARGVAGMRRMLAELEAGEAGSVAFAVPPGVAWALPLYELALLTRAHLRGRGVEPRIDVVSPEAEPLCVFGRLPSEDVRAALDRHSIGFTSAYPHRFDRGVLLLVPEDSIAADRAVALPAHRGPGIEGLPCDAMGFLPADEYGAVRGAEDVWAAGDATDFPVKQGGLAAQQADAAATSIAARFGAAVSPRPFRGVLRGIVVGEGVPMHLEGAVTGGRGESPPARDAATWWPPAKVAGRYLAPYLAAHGAPRVPAPARPPAGAAR